MEAKAILVFTCLSALALVVFADERRAPPPTFDKSETRGVFFDKLEDSIRGSRPSIAKIRESAKASAVAAAGGAGDSSDDGSKTKDLWSGLISPSSIEDEVKRVRLHFDSVVTTPGAFNSGGYQDARLDLTILATMFAVINDHSGDVRWKDQAAAARDLIARTAFNCKAGSTQVYNEAKLRKADLQDLVSGSGLSSRDAPRENDWTAIADRSPLMEYLEQLIEALEDAARDERSIKSDIELVQRNAELISVLGEVLLQEGMDEADDEDYAALSRAMSSEGSAVTEALQRMDYDAVRKGTSAIRQRCDACHEQYR